MSKFAVSYMEVYKSTYIIEADTYEEAEEKTSGESGGLYIEY